MNIHRLHPLLHRFMAPAKDGKDTGGTTTQGTDNGTTSASGAQADDAEPRTAGNAAARLDMMRRIGQDNTDRIAAEHRAEGLEFDATPSDLATTADEDDKQTSAPAPSPAPTAAPAPAATKAPVASPAPTTAPAADQITLQLSEAVPVEDLDHLKVRIKINGQLKEMTMAQMRREAQMDGAAQQRLEQATRLLDQVRSQAPAATGPAAPAPAPGKTDKTAPPVGNDTKTATSDSPAVAEMAQALTQALFDGDEAKVKQVMEQALSTVGRPQSAAPAIDPQALSLQVYQSVRQQLSMESAVAQFTTDFKDIVADPFLAEIADRNYAALMQADPQKDAAAALTEAGQMTHEWMRAHGMKPITEREEPTNRSGKLRERKQAIDNVTGLSSKATTDEPVVESASQVMERMRQQRVQAVQGGRQPART